MPFDIGFIELCTILVVSLIVLGPDKLPIAARALTRFFRTISRTMNSFKREVDRELQMDELKRQMQEQQERLANVVGQANSTIDLDSHGKQKADTPDTQGQVAVPAPATQPGQQG